MDDGFGRRIQSQIYRAGVFGRRPVVPTSPQLLEERGYAAMSRVARAYIETGAGDEATVRANRSGLERRQIVPRMLRDVSRRDLGVSLLGRSLPSPLLACPIGVLELVHPDADLAVARACRALGVPMIISSQASTQMERIADELGDCPRWFQLYWSNEDSVVESFVRRAEAIGADAIVITLDTGVLGWRTRDLDNGYLPFARGLGIAQYTSDPAFRQLVSERARAPRARERERPTREAIRSLVTMNRRYPGEFVDNLRSGEARVAVETFLDVFSRPSLTWKDLAWLRERTSLPLVLKGIQSPDDACLAVEHGVDAVICSNHGGRQCDGAIGSIDALPDIVEAVGSMVPIIFDSGIRCAADVFKALALGASAVGIGRPYLFGLALAGEAGARAVFEHFIAELDLQMANAGVESIDRIDASALSID